MRVLGIDPGTIRLGYGVVDGKDQMCMVCNGVLNLSSKKPVEARLYSLYSELNRIITEHQPDEVAIEAPFVGRNIHSALAIGRAQAVAMLAATNQGLPVYHYSPAEIKQQVTSYGGSDKQQVQQMVIIQLGLTLPPQSSDAADALATAICHLQQRRLEINISSKLVG
ncbi:MAG: crossover junction endodeoxyribonuclease RuvC [Chloroflexota bacterium]|nr:crossover junction endodeoxyribonuclease RuvC [Chloroflexota bacterium]